MLSDVLPHSCIRDSETNLKTRTALKETAKWQGPHDLSRTRAFVVCEPPNADLSTFEGVYKDADNNLDLPLTADQLLPRVSTLEYHCEMC